MNGFRTRRELLVAVAGATAAGVSGALAGCLETGESEDSDRNGTADGDENDGNAGSGVDDAEWLTTELQDARTGETFAIGEFDDPVLLHTFAIWCGTCQRQHGEFADLYERASGEFVAVELNVDPNEDFDAVADHAAENGFDWYFTVSPPEVTNALADEFGTRVTSPPASPVVLVCPDGETRVLDDAVVVPAEDLERAIGNGC